jgi:hypothetical protein
VLCHACAAGVRPQCQLCCQGGGALKETTTKGAWCHVGCALWVQEVTFEVRPAPAVCAYPGGGGGGAGGPGQEGLRPGPELAQLVTTSTRGGWRVGCMLLAAVR